MMLTTFDFLAIGTVFACLILSAMRGLVRELLDFFGWIGALIMARMFAVSAADTFLPTMTPRELAVVCGFVLVYVVVRIALVLVNHVLDFTLTKTKLTSVNRVLGALVGGVKGVFFVAIAVLVCSFSSLPESDDWKNAVSAPFFEQLASYGIDYLPDFLQDQVVLPSRSGSLDGLEPSEPKLASPSQSSQSRPHLTQPSE
ncbi:CvpA family protein [Neisseriaceae bacterium B1]